MYLSLTKGKPETFELKSFIIPIPSILLFELLDLFSFLLVLDFELSWFFIIFLFKGESSFINPLLYFPSSNILFIL